MTPSDGPDDTAPDGTALDGTAPEDVATPSERSPWMAPEKTARHEPAWRLGPEDDGPTQQMPLLVALPRREGLRATVAVLVVTGLVATGLGLLGWSHRTSSDPVAAGVGAAPEPEPTAPGPSASSAVPDPPVPTGPPVYLAPVDLCAQADFTALRPTFNQLGDLLPAGGDSGPVQRAQCQGSTGNASVQGTFSFEATVYLDPAVARQDFDTGRTSIKSHATPVTSTGQAAYLSVLPAGQAVEIYDGNLRIRLTWTADDGRTQPPPGTTQALVDVCQSTMRLLHAD